MLVLRATEYGIPSIMGGGVYSIRYLLMSMCTTMVVTLCSLMKSSLGFSPGGFLVE